MDDISKPITDATDKISGATDAASEKLEQLPDVVSKFAEEGFTKVEDTLNNVTEKTDTVFNVLDNFFKKF